ncbi:putative protein FAM90A9P [Tupaia chinensis]|uniref:putative protein FAM90A9P n=1 Tax=Tupaia chinensis TaxID=246437 RepID=UPI0007043FB2|nr:putative protein FAM90A9P [Tupaia chinensis]
MAERGELCGNRMPARENLIGATGSEGPSRGKRQSKTPPVSETDLTLPRDEANGRWSPTSSGPWTLYCPEHKEGAEGTRCSESSPSRGGGPQDLPMPLPSHPQVKCRDCGAFGHTARSRRCPMKCWAGALAPQPLGPSTKENLGPKKPLNAHDAAPFNKAEREKEQRQRQEEEKRKALLQKFPKMLPGRQQKGWKEVTESCDYVRSSESAACQGIRFSHFGQPVPVVKLADNGPAGGSLEGPQAASQTLGLGHTFHPQAEAKRPAVNTQADPKPATQRLSQVSNLRSKAPGKRPAVSSMRGCHNLPKKPRLDSSQTPRKTTETPELEAVHILPPPSNPTGLTEAVSPRVTKDTLSPLPSSDLQPRHDRPRLNTDHASTVSHHPPPSHVPGQPLRVVFRRLDNGWWSSRLMTSPSPCPPERSTPPAQSSHVPEKSEGHCTRVPLSVLYEDLRLSSSSEESDWD